MASLVYNSFFDDVLRGNINPEADTFFVMLVSSAYTEDKDAHTKRSNVTNEIAGTGYVAGGQAATATIAKDNATDRVTITFAAVNWPTSTITARKAVYYKRRGGAASADELVGVNDFGSDVTSTAGTFALPAATLTIQN
jgi:hypothetical protein